MDRDGPSAAEAVAACLIRPRDPADVDACVEVLADVHAVDGYPMNWPTSPGAWLRRSSMFASFVAVLGGRVVGHIGLCCGGPGDAAPTLWSGLAGEPAQSAVVVSRLFVSPSARGLGIGALLMAGAVQEAKARGLHPVLDVLAADTAAVALYARLGWRLLGVVEQEWGPARQVSVRCYSAPD